MHQVERSDRSYAASWQGYIDGNVVSEMNRRYITNLLTATAARVVEAPGDSSEDSDDFDYDHLGQRAGSLDLIRQTLSGLSARSEDDGAEGYGKYASTIRLGRALWQSPPLSESEAARVKERLFDEGCFPPTEEVLKHAAQAVKHEEERPLPFAGRTHPFAKYSVKRYGQLLENWMTQIAAEEETPTSEQWVLLRTTRDRILLELQLEHEGSHRRRKITSPNVEDPREEPLSALTYGLPGTGKSRVIKWVIRMFTEGLQWQHGVEFVCVAFQNKVAHAMGGLTLHACGGIQVGGQGRRLEHTDVDVMFTRNQHLRWVLIDEAFMIPDELLGLFGEKLTDAAQDTRYKKRTNGSLRGFGGYNLLIFGDMNQLPPIPASAALFNPPGEKKTRCARAALDLFWGSGVDALNFFLELTIQVRCVDPWFSIFLNQCRMGALSQEMYHFFMGLPTQHTGSWLPSGEDDGYTACKEPACAALPDTWSQMAAQGEAWSAMQKMECVICAQERLRRNRLVEPHDPRILQEPFLSAPYVHRNNQPKYHAMLLRAVEHAKRGANGSQHVLWVRALDRPHNPKELASTPAKLKKKMDRYLQFHDQKTSGVPGLLPLYFKMKARVTEKIAKGNKLTILKHTSCIVVGWVLHEGDRKNEVGSERLLNYLPRIILVLFEGQTWQVHPELPVGVFPLKPVNRDWVVNEGTGAKATRKGFTLVPDFASTGFMIQEIAADAGRVRWRDVYGLIS